MALKMAAPIGNTIGVVFDNGDRENHNPPILVYFHDESSDEEDFGITSYAPTIL